MMAEQWVILSYFPYSPVEVYGIDLAAIREAARRCQDMRFASEREARDYAEQQGFAANVYYQSAAKKRNSDG